MNFITVKKNISMTRGDTLSFGVKLKYADQEADNIIFSCSQNYNSEYIFQKKLGDGVSIAEVVDDGRSPVYRVRISPEDTHDIPIGDYFYDVQLNINDDVFTVLRGTLHIEPEVTR